MRIILINRLYYPHIIGGTEVSVKLLAEGLVKRGHTVAVITTDSEIDEDTRDTINNVEVYRIYINRSRILKLKELRVYDPVVEKTLKCIDAFRPDIIHINNTNFLFSFLKAARMKQILTVYTIRDYQYLDEPINQVGNSIFKTTMQKIYYKIRANKFRDKVAEIDAITAASGFVLSLFTSHKIINDTKKLNVIFNSVTLNINDVKEIVDWKMANHLKSENIKFLFAGRLDKEKGVIDLVEVFKKSNRKDITLTICGTGELSNYVKQVAAFDDRIVYKGKLGLDEMAAEYKNSDVVIVPSLWEEPFGRILIEAAKYGSAVIASSVGGIPEVVNTLKSGWLYDPKDKNNLLKLINSMSLKLINQKIQNIPSTIDNFSIVKQIDSFLALYEKVIKENTVDDVKRS